MKFSVGVTLATLSLCRITVSNMGSVGTAPHGLDRNGIIKNSMKPFMTCSF
jgi:hypothetical protein